MLKGPQMKQIPTSDLPKEMKSRVLRGVDKSDDAIKTAIREIDQMPHGRNAIAPESDDGVGAHLDRLSNALEHLKEITLLLEDRLATILRPTPVGPDQPKASTEEGSAIAEVVKANTITVNNITDALTALCARIDI